MATPDGWTTASLGEVCDLRMGGTPARKEGAYWDPAKQTQNRWVAISDIRSRFLVDTAEYISDLGVQKSPVKRIEPGIPLMSFKLTIGRATIPRVPVYTNEAIVALVPRIPAIRGYLFYAVPPIASSAVAADAVKGKTLNKEMMQKLRLLLPPLPEQRKIAAILSSVDEVIEKTEAVIEQLQVVKKSMMQELLTRGLPGRHTRFKQTEIGEVPQEWEVTTLGALASFVTSGSRGWAQHYAASGSLFIRSQNVRMGVLDLSDRAYVQAPPGAEGQRTRVQGGDVLITITGNSVGNVAVVPRDFHEEAFVSQHVGLVRLHDPGLAPFVTAYLSPGGPGNEQVLAAQYGQSKPGLNLHNLRSFALPVPPPAERCETEAAIGGTQERTRAEAECLAAAKAAKAALMSVLLTGELRVMRDEDAA